MHTAYGILQGSGTSYDMLPYGKTGTSEQIDVNTDLEGSINSLAHQDGLLFMEQQISGVYFYQIAELTAVDNINFIKRLNIGGELGFKPQRSCYLSRHTLHS